MMQDKKVQLNVYIPASKRTYLHQLSEDLDISQSDLAWMMIDFFENNKSPEDIRKIRRLMLTRGTTG